MADFLLLGQVPGTSIQITFWAWLLALSIISVVFYMWYSLFHLRRLVLALVYVTLRLSTRRYQSNLVG